MLNSKGSRAHKRESRPTSAAERLPNCLLAGDIAEDNIHPLRVQLLTREYAVSAPVANLLAQVVWEVRHG